MAVMGASLDKAVVVPLDDDRNGLPHGNGLHIDIW